MLLIEALHRGVTVIAAHCGTRCRPFQQDYLPQFLHLARGFEDFYGDTSALNLPFRWYAYRSLLNDKTIRDKLVHGSDWPIMPIPSPQHVGFREALSLLCQKNDIRRDLLIKQKLGFDDAYWHRAAKILRLQQPLGKPGL